MRILLTFFSVILLLSACANGSEKGYKNFLSDDEDTLSILIVDYSLNNSSIEEIEAQGIEKLITKVYQSTTLDIKDDKYDLGLKNKPAYVVFNNKEIVYKTYSEASLFDFLKSYNK
ncbi:hypothetical protein ACFFIX_19445 [Metabacillus herbersteinensis]|uniref:DUF4358 domain-containing protein n=1 Tax=Metabacillus herbersteinensis TaxID=283816 RepID=A0ABV6GJ17_9BACI